MFPKVVNSRVDSPVTNILQAKTNDIYIADMIFPTVLVKDDSGIIPAIKNDHLREYTSKRAVYDESTHRIKFEYDLTDQYQLDYHDLEIYLPQRIIDQARLPFNARRDSSFTLKETMELDRELELARQMTDITVITNNITLVGPDQFSDPSSRPEIVIQDALDAARRTAKRRMNSMVIGYAVVQALKSHPWATNQYNGLKTLSEEAVISLIKSYFGLKNVYVGEALYISSNEGQTDVTSDVWANDIVVFFKPESPSLFKPSFGYCFKLSSKVYRATTRRHQNDTGEIQKVEKVYQDKILDVDSAYLIKDAV